MINDGPENKAARRYGARVAKTERWTSKPSNVIKHSYGDGMMQRYERKRNPYFQHRPTGLYVQHYAGVLDSGSMHSTGQIQYLVPGTGHLRVLPKEHLQPAPAGMDIMTAARHNRALLRRTPHTMPPMSEAGPRPVDGLLEDVLTGQCTVAGAVDLLTA